MSSCTPTFRVEMSVPGYAYSPAAWPTKHCGRPNDATLSAYVSDFELSTRPGGVNAHLGVTAVRSARVIRQATDEVVARYPKGS